MARTLAAGRSSQSQPNNPFSLKTETGQTRVGGIQRCFIYSKLQLIVIASRFLLLYHIDDSAKFVQTIGKLKNWDTIQRLSPNWEFVRQVTQSCHPGGILFVIKRSAEGEQDSSRMTCYLEGQADGLSR